MGLAIDFLAQDNFGKLLDSCVAFVGRSFDQGSWIRRPARESLLANGSGRESPAPRTGTGTCPISVFQNAIDPLQTPRSKKKLKLLQNPKSQGMWNWCRNWYVRIQCRM